MKCEWRVASHQRPALQLEQLGEAAAAGRRRAFSVDGVLQLVHSHGHVALQDTIAAAAQHRQHLDGGDSVDDGQQLHVVLGVVGVQVPHRLGHHRRPVALVRSSIVHPWGQLRSSSAERGHRTTIRPTGLRMHTTRDNTPSSLCLFSRALVRGTTPAPSA